MSKIKSKFPAQFFRVPTAVFYLGLSTYDLVVFMTLCRFYPTIKPSLSKIAELCDISKPRVSKSIQNLKKLGLITYKKGGTGHASVYTLNFEKLVFIPRQSVETEIKMDIDDTAASEEAETLTLDEKVRQHVELTEEEQAQLQIQYDADIAAIQNGNFGGVV